MQNIVLARIDDRLIHGQVVTAWLKQVRANIILVIDDELSQNSFMSRLLKATAPPGTVVMVFDVKQAVEYIISDQPNENRLLILVKTPQVFEQLIDEGIELKEIIMGGMGFNDQRKRINKNISVSEDELESIKRLIGRVQSFKFQLVPDERAIDMKSIV